jgi:hypothetical protein
MAAALDRLAYEALPVAKSSAPFNLIGIECADGVVGGPVVLVNADNALFRLPPPLESVATAAHMAVVNGAPIPSKPWRLDRLLEKLASSPVGEDAKPVDVLLEHIADRLDENGALPGILALVADEIATKMKTSELVAAIASEFEAEVAKKLPRLLFDRVINPKGPKRRRISLDQSRLT